MSQLWDIDSIVPGSTSPATGIQKIIDAFNALKTHFSGNPADIATPFAGQLILDTSVTPNVFRKRNAANSAWEGVSVAKAASGEQAAQIQQLRSRVDGLNLSPNGTTTCGISAGVVMDSTDSVMLSLASAFTKTTAAWAVGSGNGAFDGTGAAPTTADWFHWFVIRRPDTGVEDVLFSHSLTAPTLPANYTQFGYIGSTMSIATTGVWRAAIHDGDHVQWSVPSTSEITQAVNVANTNFYRSFSGVPKDIKTIADITGYIYGGAFGDQLSINDPAIATTTPSAALGTAAIFNGGSYLWFNAKVRTDTTQGVNLISNVSTLTCVITCLGYTNTRGRNA